MTDSTGAAGATTQQAAAFLAQAVHAEVDAAQVGPVRVLHAGDGSRVYAVALVRGPLRSYVATAWGPAGSAGHRGIVSYPDPAAAQAALDAVVARQQRQGYADLGTVDGAG